MLHQTHIDTLAHHFKSQLCSVLLANNLEVLFKLNLGLFVKQVLDYLAHDFHGLKALLSVLFGNLGGFKGGHGRPVED